MLRTFVQYLHFLIQERGLEVQSDPLLNGQIENIARELGIDIVRTDFILSYADHIPFARRGIPVTQIASTDYSMLLACHNGPDHACDVGLINHSKNDLPENIHSRHLIHTTQILTEFLSRTQTSRTTHHGYPPECTEVRCGR